MENQNREEVLIHLKSMNDEMKKKIKANKTMLAEMVARMAANHEKRMARMDAWLTDMRIFRRETTACQETMGARLEAQEPASVDTTPEVAHEQEVPLEVNLEKIEPNPGETEAVVERQQTTNEEVAINSPRACQDERTTCQETMEACLEGKEEPVLEFFSL
jgi:hypothetical protein